MHVVSMLKKHNEDLNVDAWWDRIKQADKNGGTNPYVPYDYCSSQEEECAWLEAFEVRSYLSFQLSLPLYLLLVLFSGCGPAPTNTVFNDPTR
jgi:hypothetical protein